jgi:hypothetical protein
VVRVLAVWRLIGLLAVSLVSLVCIPMIRVMVMFPLVSVPLLARILVFAVPASVVVAIALPCIFTVPASVIVSTGLPCEKNDH